MKIWGSLWHVFFIFAVSLSSSAPAAVLFVDVNSSNPTPPYADWSTAATTIQAAVDAAVPGDQVLVASGVYRVGQSFLIGSNRVTIAKAITVKSVSGPVATVIEGYQVPAVTNGASSIRCVYLGNGAILSGFTLTNGSTANNSYANGGGIYCESATGYVTNCVVSGNNCGMYGVGGGGYKGAYIDCLIPGNVGGSSSSGGGVAYGCLTNCAITANSARNGGGVYMPVTLINCTVANNTASSIGGGVYSGGGGLYRNSIVYFNRASGGSNYYQSVSGSITISNCCAPEFSFATCFTNLPGLVDPLHGDLRLQLGSPCLNAGDNQFATAGPDLDGNPRIFGENVDLGAYENSFDGIAHFVSLGSKNPAAPYTNWTTAATNIQDAIDIASAGEPVIVSNGVYRTGGRLVDGALTNRVVLDKAITLASLNGPAYTSIVGGYAFGATAVRCVYLANNAALWGFTLTNGATANSGDTYKFESGGGAWCESTNAWIGNCLITRNRAFKHGGGAYSGTLINCSVTANNAYSYGGGTAFGTLLNCAVSNNYAADCGGGAFGGRLADCVLKGNYAISGGGSGSNILGNSQLINNISGKNGGGAFYSSLTNCNLSGNQATNGYGGGAAGGLLTGCVLATNLAWNGGGAGSNSLISCLLTGNIATNNGGAVYAGNLVNCTLAGNSATNYGGGAFAANLTNCIVNANLATFGGGVAGGISYVCQITNNWAISTGGGALSNRLINCLLSSNAPSSSAYSRLSGCLIIRNMYRGSYFDVLDNCLIQLTYLGYGAIGSTLNHCTVRYNTYGVTACFATNSIIYHNSTYNFYNTYVMEYCCTTPIFNGPGNFTNAPLFLDALHLQSNSPCIDAGHANLAAGSVDFDGRPRLVGNAVDVGASEFQGADLEPFIAALAQYDLPNDGSADFADSDGDGLNNWQEWIAGTNPTNTASVLKMVSPTSNGSGITVTWQSATNVTYYLQVSTNLTAQPGFTSVQSNLVGQAGFTSYTDTRATNGGAYFYRVGVQ